MRGTIDGNAMKGLIVMIMLLVTLFVVLVHAEDRRPFSLFHSPFATLSHPFPLPTRFLSFSPHDDAKSRKKKTHRGSNGSKSKKKRTPQESSGSTGHTEEEKEKLKKCYQDCYKKNSLGRGMKLTYVLHMVGKCKEDCRRTLGFMRTNNGSSITPPSE
jgi:hypothetical protein